MISTIIMISTIYKYLSYTCEFTFPSLYYIFDLILHYEQKAVRIERFASILIMYTRKRNELRFLYGEGLYIHVKSLFMDLQLSTRNDVLYRFIYRFLYR